MNIFKYALIILSVCIIAGCATSDFSDSDINYFQSEITTDIAPERPLDVYNLYGNTVTAGLTEFKAIIPSYNGKGNLLASWTPNPAGTAGRPTIVIIHGGHGLVPTDFSYAVWAAKELNANILLLDSYWSRGRQENWLTWTKYGVDMRVLDVIAAGRWLQIQGIDKDKLFLMGGSQGGWTVLRTFTKTPFIEKNLKGIYRAGFSLYPNCNSKGTRDDPTLGPYWAPVLVFTGGKDVATPPSACPTRVFKEAHEWTHYPLGTHAWDTANRGWHTPAKDGECSNALNIYNKFIMCHSRSITEDVYGKIKNFIKSVEN
jgi:dienelactone hydrolase